VFSDSEKEERLAYRDKFRLAVIKYHTYLGERPESRESNRLRKIENAIKNVVGGIGKFV
jgi:hypothetical protein